MTRGVRMAVVALMAVLAPVAAYAQASIAGPIAARIEDPVKPVSGPYRRFAQGIFIERSRVANIQDGIGTEFFPM